MNNNTTRFSDRVADYVQYRPSYPAELIPLLQAQIGLSPEWLVADMGCGTGLSALPFLEYGNQVIGIEPNAEMLEAAKQSLQAYPNFSGNLATAEASGQPDSSLDLIISGQAFHWFDQAAAKAEWRRILRPEGHIVLVWNQRDKEDAFQQAYEELLRQHIRAYQAVKHRDISAAQLYDFFSPRTGYSEQLSYTQQFDLPGLKGRLLSASYCPKSGPEHDRLMPALEQLFDQFAQGAKLTFLYRTFVYWC